MDINAYLAQHVGKRLPPVSITTGNTFYVGLPHRRAYQAEIIAYDDLNQRVTLWLTSIDYAPSGANERSREPVPNGEYTLRLLDTSSLLAVWRALILVADPQMIDYIASLRPA